MSHDRGPTRTGRHVSLATDLGWARVRRRLPSPARRVRMTSFPLRAPSTPRNVAPGPTEKSTGAHYDTDWARRWPARMARAAIVEGPMRLSVSALAAPQRRGSDRLGDVDGPVIFAANHHSHLDTPLLLTSIPEPWRHKVVVGAAADYFFGTRLSGAVSALAIGAIPIERSKVGRPLRRLGGRTDRWRVESAHLSGGRSQPRRVGPTIPGRRGVSSYALCGAGCAYSSRRHRPHPSQGQVDPPTKSYVGHFWRPDRAPRRRKQCSVRRPARGHGGGPRRRGPHRLVLGPQAQLRAGEPFAHRTRHRRLAAGLGAGRSLSKSQKPPSPLARDLDILSLPVGPHFLLRQGPQAASAPALGDC